MSERESSNSITIFSAQPADISQNQYEELGLLELMRGYGFEEDLMDQAKLEYGEDEPGKLIYFARDAQGKIIGSLGVHPVYPDIKGVNASFYESVADISEEAAQKIQGLNISIWNVDGIILHPSARGKGLSKLLLKAFIESEHPAIVIGRTKTPEAVLTRANTLAQYGFRTWYGFTEVTPYDLRYPESFIDHRTVLTAYALFKGGGIGDNAEMFVSPDILSPVIPDLSRIPDYIREAYQVVVNTQQTENNSALEGNKQANTAVLPLIAICVGN